MAPYLSHAKVLSRQVGHIEWNHQGCKLALSSRPS